jgi:hypothetical protein
LNFRVQNDVSRINIYDEGCSDGTGRSDGDGFPILEIIRQLMTVIQVEGCEMLSVRIESNTNDECNDGL